MISARRDLGPILAGALIFGSVGILCAGVANGESLRTIAPVSLGIVSIVTLYQLAGERLRPTWMNMLALVALVIMLIPIRRYEIPGHLPFVIEPYRVLVALVAAVWLLSLLVDPRVRARGSFLNRPLFLIAAVCVLSILVNAGRVNAQGVTSIAMKGLTFLLSYLLVFYILVSVVKSRKQVEKLLRVLVGSAAIVAVAGLIEYQSHVNLFNHLHTIMPFLKPEPFSPEPDRGGHARIYASAQHPIALSAVLVMLLPFALYLARTTKKRRWWVACGLIGMASIETISRTGILMLIVSVVVYIILRPAEVKPLWPAIFPLVIVLHFAAPGAVGTLADAFFPKGGIVAQQEGDAGGRGSGRVADLGPGFKLFLDRPVLGLGFSTRVVDGPKTNAFIYDNQWLDNLVEVGAIGTLAWLWLFGRFVRRTGRAAKEDKSDRGLLFCALTASTAAFAVGMFTFDAFSFIQCTFVLFILMSLGSVLLAERARRTRPRIVSA